MLTKSKSFETPPDAGKDVPKELLRERKARLNAEIFKMKSEPTISVEMSSHVLLRAGRNATAGQERLVQEYQLYEFFAGKANLHSLLCSADKFLATAFDMQ